LLYAEGYLESTPRGGVTVASVKQAQVNPAPAAPKRAAQKAGAAKSIAHTIHHVPQIVHVAVARIVRGGPGVTRQGTGTGGGGTSRGNGTGSGGQGTGTGSGGRGTGNGGYAASNEPCGYVEFIRNAKHVSPKWPEGYWPKIPAPRSRWGECGSPWRSLQEWWRRWMAAQ